MEGLNVAAPLYVSWNCTRRCHLRCRHCFVDVTRVDDRAGELSTERGIELIDAFAAADVCLLSFAGAEPLVREDFFVLADHAHSRGLTIVTSTNGIPVTEAVAARLQEVGFQSLQISLDGATADVHEALRGRGTFAPAMAAIEHCRRRGLDVVLATAAHRINVNHLEPLFDLAKRLEVSSFKLQPVLGPGHRLSGPIGGLSIAEALDACERADVAFRGTGIRLALSLWAGIARSGSRATECSNGFEHALVLDDASVAVCEAEPGSGSALDGRFLESWRTAVRMRAKSPRCGCSPFIDAARRAAA